VRIIVTAGPTREPIDPVRYLSNRSSGKMGYAIAEAAIADGHDVTLISGPTALTPPAGARFVSITTCDDLYEAVHRSLADADVLVMCAAVSDYKPTTPSTEKMEKRPNEWSLRLIPTRDILGSIAEWKTDCFVVGFAAQTHDLRANALRKLHAKNCDMIVANDVSGSDSGMESDDNEVTIFLRNGEEKFIPRAPKKIIAREILKIVFAFQQKSLTKKS
jgi:phosphopantothenoylcysteine decarboxylase / phosphopantothenate---cysteine ligase